MASTTDESIVETKAELPSKEVSTAELPSPFADTKSPWTATASPIEQGQHAWKMQENQTATTELPAYQMTKGGYQELPG